jgi:hypothetical protein
VFRKHMFRKDRVHIQYDMQMKRPTRVTYMCHFVKQSISQWDQMSVTNRFVIGPILFSPNIVILTQYYYANITNTFFSDTIQQQFHANPLVEIAKLHICFRIYYSDRNNPLLYETLCDILPPLVNKSNMLPDGSFEFYIWSWCITQTLV